MEHLTEFDAVHEAAHAIAGAFVGLETVAILSAGRRPRCHWSGQNATIRALVIAGMAGFAADLHLQGFDEETAAMRAGSDFGIIEQIGRAVTSNEKWLKDLSVSGQLAAGLVLRFQSEIRELATLLQSKGELNSDEFEALELVKRVRQIGKEEIYGSRG